MAFNHDGTLLASAGDDGMVRLWDPASGDPVGDPLTGHDGAVTAVAFNHDGTLLASAGADGTVRLWDPTSGEPVGDPLTGHDGAVTAVAFNHDGTLLASAGADGTVRLWDPASGEPVGDPLTGHDGAVTRWRSTRRHPARLRRCRWHGAAVGPRQRRTRRRPTHRPRRRRDAVAFNHDGTLLASAGADATVRLWDPASGEPVGEPLTGHDGAVTRWRSTTTAPCWPPPVRMPRCGCGTPPAANPVGDPLTGQRSGS